MRKFEIVKAEKRLFPNAKIKLPVRATKNSAGYDMYSPVDAVVKAQTAELIFTDVKADFGAREMLMLCVTSKMGKNGIIMANGVGIVESDYYSNIDNDGNLGFRLYNFSNNDYVIKAGDKIGQGVFMSFHTVDDEEEVTTERVGGFGSTLKK